MGEEGPPQFQGGTFQQSLKLKGSIMTTKKSPFITTILAAIIILSAGCAASRTTSPGKTRFALLSWESNKTTQTTIGIGKGAVGKVRGSNNYFTEAHKDRVSRESEASYRERLRTGKVSIMESIENAKRRKNQNN